MKSTCLQMTLLYTILSQHQMTSYTILQEDVCAISQTSCCLYTSILILMRTNVAQCSSRGKGPTPCLLHLSILMPQNWSRSLLQVLNSQFIVTARMDFQISPQIFRSNIIYSTLGRTRSSALISGRGSGDLALEHSPSTSLKSE